MSPFKESGDISGDYPMPLCPLKESGHKPSLRSGTLLRSQAGTVRIHLMWILTYAPSCTFSLQLCHPPENSVLFSEKLRRAALFHHLPVRKDNDPVRSFHYAHTMRDDQYRLSCQEP